MSAENKIKYRSYDEVLEDILSEYEAVPPVGSEERKRLEVLSHQIFTIEKLIEEAERECFVGTASGVYLDLLAGEYGLERKGERCSHGTLELSFSDALDYDVGVPKGSIFAAENGTQYETSENCVIESGAVAVNVAAQSLTGGETSNAPAETIRRIVSAPAKIEFVRNVSDFLGGADAESDSALRARILERMRGCPTGANEQFYRLIALSNESVGKVKVVPLTGEVKVCVWGFSDKLGESDIKRLSDEYAKKSPLGINVTVTNAKAYSADIGVYIKPSDGFTFDEAKADATEKIEDFFESVSIGEGLRKAKVYALVMACESVADMSLAGSFEDIETEEDEILTRGTISIREMT